MKISSLKKGQTVYKVHKGNTFTIKIIDIKENSVIGLWNNNVQVFHEKDIKK